jgi:hypothetical protein
MVAVVVAAAPLLLATAFNLHLTTTAFPLDQTRRSHMAPASGTSYLPSITLICSGYFRDRNGPRWDGTGQVPAAPSVARPPVYTPLTVRRQSELHQVVLGHTLHHDKPATPNQPVRAPPTEDITNHPSLNSLQA